MPAKRTRSKTRRATAPTPSPPPEQAKRIPFYDVAEPLFVRYGFRKTTVEDICKAAGASKRTFYQLFRDKADLAARMVLHIALTIVERWQGSVKDVTQASRKLDLFLDEYVRLCRERPVFRMMFDEPAIIRACSTFAEEVQVSPLVGVFVDILRQGVRSGEFRKLDPEATVWIVYTLLDSMHFLMPVWSGLPGPLDDPKLARQLRAFIFNGLGYAGERK